jgi:hypothetical protein
MGLFEAGARVAFPEDLAPSFGSTLPVIHATPSGHET